MTKKLVAQSNEPENRIQLWENMVDGNWEYELIIDGIFIMASYNHLSSELLIRHSMQHLAGQDNISILVAGLGMGFTVKEACLYPEVINVDVVEIESTVVEFNYSYLSNGNNNCLNDKRVNVILDDFYSFVINTDNKYHLISMDIDNGPMMLVKQENCRVYNMDFFYKIKEHMQPQGVFVIWSCNHEEDLLKKMQKVFRECYVEEVIEEHENRKISYYLYFALN